jgi:hypothetical protein
MTRYNFQTFNAKTMPKFQDIDDFVESQAVTIRPLLAHIRNIIMVSHPNIREQISWSLPFFYCFDHLCYLSVSKKTKGVEVCFAKGFHIKDEAGVLDAKGRKLVKGVTFTDLADFEKREDAFLEVLQEAIWLNETQPELKFYNMIVKKT